MKWLRANGCPWNSDARESAATRGHLEVLKWLRANGCPWNAHLEVLQWARANGCPE